MFQTVCIAAVIVLAAQSSWTDSFGEQFILARVRADGLISPVAAYVDSSWVRVRLKDRYPTITLPDQWHFVGLDGSSGRLTSSSVVQILDISEIGYDGYDDWGLLSDYSPRRFEPHTYPIPVVGFATTSPIDFKLFQTLDQQSAARSKVRTHVKSKLDSAYAKDSARVRSGSSFQWDRSDSTELTADVITMNASGMQLVFTFATQTVGRHTSPGGCDVIDTFSGWVLVDGSNSKLLEYRIVRTDCDFKEVTFEKPSATLEIAGTTYILSSLSGWESEGAILRSWDTNSIGIVELK